MRRRDIRAGRRVLGRPDRRLRQALYSRTVPTMAIEPDSESSMQLAQRASRGHAASMESLLERYLPRLRAFVRLRVDRDLRQRESSSDLVQSVCRQVLEHAEGFEYRSEEAFRAWLFKTALNKIRERARFHRAERRAPGRERRVGETAPEDVLLPMYSRITTPSEAAAAHELAERMEGAFDQLPDDYREVITLSRIVGLPRPDVAKAMERSEGAVSMLLSRALVELVAVLDGRRTS
jgi:RNA polymerase sigma-70 factor (subfamily 1)